MHDCRCYSLVSSFTSQRNQPELSVTQYEETHTVSLLSPSHNEQIQDRNTWPVHLNMCGLTVIAFSREWKPYTGLFKMIVGVLTTCHTQHTWDSSICIFFLVNRTTLQVFVTYLTGALYVPPLPPKYPGTEGTNQNRHWNHHRWHATDSLERTGLSCWCL